MSNSKKEFQKRSVQKLWSINQELKKIYEMGVLTKIELFLLGEKKRADFNQWKLQEIEIKEKHDRSTKASLGKIKKNEARKIYYKAYEELQIKFNKETIPKKIVENYLEKNSFGIDWEHKDINRYHKEARAKFKLS